MSAESIKYRTDTLRRWAELTTERSSWMSHWQEISTYLLPRAGRFFSGDRNRGTRRHNNIYDSTATRSLRILSAGMMAGMTSPARPWFRLGTTDPDLAKYQPVKIWLADCTRLMLTVFQKSNTYRAFHQYYHEQGAFGTSAGIVTDDFKNVLHHHVLTAGEYAISTNWDGEVTTIYREFEKNVAQIVEAFGYDNCSLTIRRMWDNKQYGAWIKVIHAIEPRAERDNSKKDARNMAWSSCYYEAAGESNAKPLRESGFDRFPAMVARWDVGGGDIYGNSPGMEALGDIKGLQHKQLRKAEGIDYKTKPPLQAPVALKNKENDMLPGGMTYYDGTNTSPGVRTLFDVNIDLQHLLLDIQDNRNLIKEAFNTDMFLMLSNSQGDPRKTATEVAELHEEKMLMLGPTIEREHHELLTPSVDGCFARLLEAGLLPPAPQELDGKPLNVEYISVLAQAQRAIATNGIDRFVSNLGAISSFKPGILDKFDEDEWADAYGDMIGVDPRLIVASDKVALIRQDRARQAEAAQKAAMANSAADTANKLANSPTASDNALTALAGGVGGDLLGQGPRSATAPFTGYN
jgi:hypothetical protein